MATRFDFQIDAGKAAPKAIRAAPRIGVPPELKTLPCLAKPSLAKPRCWPSDYWVGRDVIWSKTA
jgi:hypothetical protein